MGKPSVKPRRGARDLDRESLVADRLHSAAVHLLRRLRSQHDAAGLSGARLSALSVIVFAGPLTLGELAAAEHVKPPTVTRIVAGLEQLRLVMRERDPHDGRITRLRATPKGVRLMQLGRRRRVSYLAGRLRALPRNEIELVKRATDLIERLARHD